MSDDEVGATRGPGATKKPPETFTQPFDAFLSYDSADRRWAKRIQRFLQSFVIKKPVKRHLRVYLDSTDIRGGALRREIESALSASRLLVVCCSPDAADSEWVNKEIAAYRRLHEQANVALVLIRGEPSGSIPRAAADLEPRYHDVRRGWALGFPLLAARDELARLIALIIDGDLRSLIDWSRRRALVQLATAVTGIAAAATGVARYVNAQRRIKAADLRAIVTYESLEGDIGPSLLDYFVTDVTCRIFGATAIPAIAPRPGWPGKDSRMGDAATLGLESSTLAPAQHTRPTVDGTTFTPIRTYYDFKGELGPFVEPATWREAWIEARIDAMVPREQWRSSSGPGDDARSLQQEFDGHYGISIAEKESWNDYSVVAVPIRARFELSVGGRVLGQANGFVAHVREWDEDVRGLHVLYFQLFKTSAEGA